MEDLHLTQPGNATNEIAEAEKKRLEAQAVGRRHTVSFIGGNLSVLKSNRDGFNARYKTATANVHNLTRIAEDAEQHLRNDVIDAGMYWIPMLLLAEAMLARLNGSAH